jgi:release factor glutamine methyltransferase
MTAPIALEVLGEIVELEPAEGVFTPSPHGLFYASAVRVRRGERVIDIGTGSGILGIAAARRGARVVVTDVEPRAVAAAERNALRNGVVVEGRVGSLFAGTTGSYDVILANLPNEIVAPAHLARLDPSDARAFAGGEGGNEALLALLAAARPYMHASSRLYLGVHAMTDYHGTMRAALNGYAARLLDFAPLPAKDFVLENLDFYRELDEAGIIRLYRNADGRWMSYAYMYELTLPEEGA